MASKIPLVILALLAKPNTRQELRTFESCKKIVCYLNQNSIKQQLKFLKLQGKESKRAEYIDM